MQKKHLSPRQGTWAKAVPSPKTHIPNLGRVGGNLQGRAEPSYYPCSTQRVLGGKLG